MMSTTTRMCRIQPRCGPFRRRRMECRCCLPGSLWYATWEITGYTRIPLRQAIEQGWIPGPVIINSGIIIGGVGGQFYPTPEMVKEHNIVYPEYLDADTPDEIIKAVRQNVLFGAKVIKICVDCKAYLYSADEIRLV